MESMTDRDLLEQIAELRALNKGMYVTIETLLSGSDKTIELVKMFYAKNPDAAKKWHREVLAIDTKILELTKKLCE